MPNAAIMPFDDDFWYFVSLTRTIWPHCLSSRIMRASYSLSILRVTSRYAWHSPRHRALPAGHHRVIYRLADDTADILLLFSTFSIGCWHRLASSIFLFQVYYWALSADNTFLFIDCYSRTYITWHFPSRNFSFLARTRRAKRLRHRRHASRSTGCVISRYRQCILICRVILYISELIFLREIMLIFQRICWLISRHICDMIRLALQI